MKSRKQKVWIDADTGNETDDAYAIARALAEPTIDVVGISSAHFNNGDLVAFERWNQYPTRGIDTVGISQQLNVDLARLMRRGDVPCVLGADRQVGRAWGGTEPRPSPASAALIAAVHALAPGEFLDVLALAALTNVASAVRIDPSIVPRVRCVALAARYDVATGVWNKNEFNARGDLNAFDDLLARPDFDLTLMPIETARPYAFAWTDVAARLDDRPTQRFLKDRWQETNPQDAVRILWDLALVEAYLLPQCATIVPAQGPPENGARAMRVYAAIDVPALTADFYRVTDAFE